jgi:cellulose synthase/poly-beta-1,6-N-acetylglucosamine synthase-like glycosyltransferase
MVATLNVALLLSLTALAYTWLAYPVILALAARIRPQLQPPSSLPELELPHISIILSAYNEESVIAGRIANILAIDYPNNKFDVYLGTDGCTDGTAETARAAANANPRIHIKEFSQNRGKVAVLRDLVALAAEQHNTEDNNTTRLLAFSDANTMFAPNALQKLSRHFSNPAVGGVCGRLVFVRDGDTDNPAEEGVYWRMETQLKTWESTLDSCLGANGAIYAIRPELFWHAIPGNTIVDDFVIGMKVREQGSLMRYDPEAVATEDLPEVTDEWVRRVRIGAGDYQALSLCRHCLLPRFGWFAWSFWSHKVLRWLTPHAAVITALISLPLAMLACFGKLAGASAVLNTAVASGLVAILAAAALGRVLRGRERTSGIARLCAICDHFVTMHAALLVGFLRYCTGNRSGAWRRTPRAGQQPKADS